MKQARVPVTFNALVLMSSRLPLAPAVAVILAAFPPVSLAITSFDDPSQYVWPPDRSSGLVRLDTFLYDGSSLPCSGALVMGKPYVVTAAHCVTNDNGEPDVSSITVTFNTSAPQSQTTSTYAIRPGWTGDLRTGNDVAVIALPGGPPPGTVGYSLPGGDYFYPQLPVLIEGHGRAGQGSATLDDRLPRVAVNHYDTGGGGWLEQYYLMDFDNYVEFDPSNPKDPVYKNMLGEPGYVTYDGVKSYTRLDLDFDGNSVLGEGMLAEGDSGGPTSADNVLLGIHSWSAPSAAFGTKAGDSSIIEVLEDKEDLILLLAGNTLSGEPSGFGWIGADTQVWRHVDWINSVIANDGPYATTVPAPPAIWLLVTGLGVLGLRRSRLRRLGASA